MNTSSSQPSAPISALGPMRIEIGGLDSASYKSIDNLVWDNIPAFVVLTGVNGSGKTQLLELLAYKLTETQNPEVPNLHKVRLVITGDNFAIEDVAYLPNEWNFSNPVIGIGQMLNAKLELYGQLVQPQNISSNIRKRAMRSRLERLLGVPLNKLDQKTFAERLPDDFAFMLEEADVTAGLGHVFLAHRLRTAEELERGTPAAEVSLKLGPAPWDVINEAFQAADFPYRVVSPLTKGFLDPYEVRLESHEGQILRPRDLSSGEIRLMGLVLWLYSTKHHGRFPRLLLLDEPDAHLHPSMTRHFLDVIKEVLVDRYKVRVILSTHSPSTVALAPDGSVFEMLRTNPRTIVPSKSKADSIGLLTAGLVIVSPGSRFVVVEDEDDVEFYDAIRDVLSDYGPSRDPRAIKPSPSLAFLPASIGKGKGKIGGGRSIVSSWVDKFDQAPLDKIIRGVIDRDTGNAATERVRVLGRYSIENYLLDPFVVFGVLLDQGTAPTISGITISQGDEHRLRAMNQAELQTIVTAIAAKVEPTIPSLTAAERLPQMVSFTNGRSVQYPTWMIDRRGHDLLPLYQAVFAGPAVISPPRLYRSLRRVRLIPIELAEILDKLQE